MTFWKRLWWALCWVWECVATFCRALRLIATFVPLIVTYPLGYISPRVKLYWRLSLLSGLEFSGPIFIKLGQWASTRRDLFSSELCDALSKLQRSTKPHSWLFTLKQLEFAYGPYWRSIVTLVGNNNEPIGSGCCAQVYKAWVNSEASVTVEEDVKRSQTWLSWWEWLEVLSVTSWLKTPKFSCEVDENKAGDSLPVAIKVLHPGIHQIFARDLRILKLGAICLSTLIPPLRWLDPVACLQEFSEHMLAQIDMRLEAAHTEHFLQNFESTPKVVFPRPINSLITPHILVETYETGEPMDRFLESGPVNAASVQFKQELAKMVVDMLLKMVFHDNFVHGDLHPGNLMVKRLSPRSSPQEFVFPDFMTLTLGDDVFYHGITESRSMEPEIELIVLDCGIVSSLRNELLMKRFRQTFKAIVLGHGEEVAELFLETSYHKCSNIPEFSRSMAAIVNQARSEKLKLSKIDVADLMKQVFQLLLEHRVRLESQFSMVILSVLVLEGLGRSLDPELDLLQRAVPFLL